MRLFSVSGLVHKKSKSQVNETRECLSSISPLVSSISCRTSLIFMLQVSDKFQWVLCGFSFQPQSTMSDSTLLSLKIKSTLYFGWIKTSVHYSLVNDYSSPTFTVFGEITSYPIFGGKKVFFSLGSWKKFSKTCCNNYDKYIINDRVLLEADTGICMILGKFLCLSFNAHHPGQCALILLVLLTFHASKTSFLHVI